MIFSKKEAIQKGWDLVKEHTAKLVGVTLALFVIQFGMSFVADAISADGTFLEAVFGFAIWVVAIILTMGFIRIGLNILEDKEFDIMTLFEEHKHFWNFFAASLLQNIIVVVGLVLLIVPGIIWGLMFSQAQYLVVDKGLGPIEALKESKKLMNGVKWNYFLFAILLGLINIVGLLLVGIGLLVTIPLTMIASVFVYKKLNEHAYGVQTVEESHA